MEGFVFWFVIPRCHPSLKLRVTHFAFKILTILFLDMKAESHMKPHTVWRSVTERQGGSSDPPRIRPEMNSWRHGFIPWRIFKLLAAGVGFEPTRPVKAYRFSRTAYSTTLASRLKQIPNTKSEILNKSQIQNLKFKTFGFRFFNVCWNDTQSD